MLLCPPIAYVQLSCTVVRWDCIGLLNTCAQLSVVGHQCRANKATV